ncbi:MAG: Fur family transcriptional regulator [Candidatus Saccharimonadales bacterium]
MNEVENFKTILIEKGASVTKTRLALFHTLQQMNKPAKTGEIAKQTPSVNRTSVYRTLELFAELGITTTIVRGWTPLVELAEPFKAHHHHIVCRNCGVSQSIESETLEDVLAVVAKRHGYTLEQHTVELTGLCSACQKTAQAILT